MGNKYVKHINRTDIWRRELYNPLKLSFPVMILHNNTVRTDKIKCYLFSSYQFDIQYHLCG